MATVTLSCLCGRQFSVDSALVGNSFSCPTCGRSMKVPGEATAPPGPVPAPLASTIAVPPRENLPSRPAPKRKIPVWFTVGAIGWTVVALIVGVPMGLRFYHQWRNDSLSKQQAQLPKQQQDRQSQLEKEVRDQQTQLTITGPASLQAGAANSYVLATKSLNGDDVAAKLTIALKDKAGKEIAPPEKMDSKGRVAYTVPLPAALKPDEELTLEVTAERQNGEQPISITEKLPLERPGFVTHVFTDKPLYQPGEVVAFRSLTLDRFSLRPVEEDLQLSYTITDPSEQVIYRFDGSAQVQDPGARGRLLEGPDGKAIRGIGFGEFAIPSNAPGGQYTLSVAELRGRFAPEKRQFLVNRYQAPRLHKELEFTRRSYGPGDEVLAACKVTRIEGGVPLAAAPVNATVIVDGQRLAADGTARDDAAIALKTEVDGSVAVRFKLPAKIDVGEASLSVQFSDGGNSETIVRPIPIVVRRLRVDFYPEGGDLIAGMPNRVYFSARTTVGKPADMKGRILNAKGQVVAEVKTLADEKATEANQGMGVFEFTPDAGQKYQLQIDSPAGIPYKPDLPETKSEGIVLKVESGVTNNAEPIRATIWSAGEKRKVLVAAYCRGRLVASENLEIGAAQSKSASLMPPSGVHGVFRITAYDDRSSATVTRLVPSAERLVFRQPANYLNVALQPDKSSYVPGEKVRLAVNSRDEGGKPAPAIALVSVVDRAALSLADDKTLRGMPAHFLLTTEVKRPEDLENADFLLSDSPLAPTAVDLLLGTQGWRRFAEHDPERFHKDHGSDADRLLAATGQTPLQVTNGREVELAARPYLNEARHKAEAEFSGKRIELQKGYAESSQAARRWENISETCAVVGIIGLVLVLIAAAIVGALTVVEKSAPGAGVALGVASVFALVALFVGFALIFSLGTKSSAKFATVGSAFTPMPTRERATDMAKMQPAAPAGGGNFGGVPPPRAQAPMEDEFGLPPGAGAGPGMPPDLNRASKGDKGLRADEPIAANTGPGRVDELKTDPAYSTGIAKQPPAESAKRRYALVQNEQRRNTQRWQNRAVPGKERSFKDLERGNRSLVDPDSAPPFVIREYAHENMPGRETRSDFTETVYWHPVLLLPGGETFVNFHLSDAITSFQALAFVHSTDGRLGSAKLEFAAKLPFSLDAKLPLEITSSDVIRLPVAVDNSTERSREVTVNVDANGLTRSGGNADARLTLDSQKRGRVLFDYKPSIMSGDARIRFDGRSDFFHDRLERSIKVVPEGFPVVGVQSGTVSRSMTATLELPKEFTAGSLKVRAEVYPSLLADVVNGLDGMLREPHGCFEQTSSSNYPNLLILDYLQSTGQARPEVTRRAMDLIERGYNRLLGFECQKRDGSGREGYEWFGGFTPPHEALTAYGLVQFHDLSKVYDRVDQQMVERTRKFLLSRRDGQGNFTRKQDYHRFGQVSQPTFNAYLTWALCESEVDAVLDKELQQLVSTTETNTDPYFLALTASALFKRNEKAAGTKILDKLVTLQSANGDLPGRESIVGSHGQDLQIEATALTVLAWLKAESPLKYRDPLQKAVRWLTSRRGGYGGFGSTQATILTLKALAQVAKDNKKLTDGQVILSLNGNPILRQDFAATATDILILELTENDLKKLKPGANEIRLEVTKNELPAKISWSYHTLQPPSAADCPVKLSTKLDKDKVNEGDTVRLTAVVENTGKESQSMTTAIIGLPAGLSLPEDLKQLQELAKPQTPLAGRDIPEYATISYYEIRGRELVLYWRGLDAGQRVEVPIDLIARVPGSYRGPASRAYLYYGADSKSWNAPLSVTIEEKVK